MSETRSAEPDEAPENTPAAATPDEPQAVFSSSAPAQPDGPTSSITARLEVGSDGSAKLVEARVSAAHPFGARNAVAHLDLLVGYEDVRAPLQTALQTALQAADTNARELAEEAALTHRIRTRELGDDFHKAPEYVGPVITVEDQIYSDAALMDLPKEERQAAIEAGVRATPRGTR